ncbi:MAG: hypothetical protein U0871_04685 [Gemmataceae bacterium]
MPLDAVMARLADGVDTADAGGNGGAPLFDPKKRRQRQPKEGRMETILEHMETPAVVRVMLARLGQLSKDRLCSHERQFKLSYYFGGLTVAARPSHRGLVIVASGPADEVGTVIGTLPRADAEQLTILTPEPLEAVLAHLPTPPRAMVG